MDVCSGLIRAGFFRVVAVRGEACGAAEQTVLLALWRYEAERTPGQSRHANYDRLMRSHDRLHPRHLDG